MMKMEQAICQSCGMPLSEDVLGSNADGSKNEEYCMYCMKEGNFTACLLYTSSILIQIVF